MSKFSVVIAHKEALPSAFVVFRGFEQNIRLAAHMGFNGIELALRTAGEINISEMEKWLQKSDLEVSAISTGQVYAENGLSFMTLDMALRKKLFSVFYELIDLAAIFGKKINIGRVRGQILQGKEEQCLRLFYEAIDTICNYAANKQVDILLEPVNRYESNFINNLQEAWEIIDKSKIDNLYIMPDIFHMNIEDPVIETELLKYRDKINYIHLADSNRYAPGWGHTDFNSIHNTLQSMNFNGWHSVEILPFPTPEKAGKQAINYLKKIWT
jgi:sugar phosphate isomerase/epimerase